jgi:hypothetical protein
MAPRTCYGRGTETVNTKEARNTRHASYFGQGAFPRSRATPARVFNDIFHTSETIREKETDRYACSLFMRGGRTRTPDSMVLFVSMKT